MEWKKKAHNHILPRADIGCVELNYISELKWQKVHTFSHFWAYYKLELDHINNFIQKDHSTIFHYQLIH